ncbi:MAG: hypothetical protein A7316_01105 [Candidatus Altiarchaeales archaeon WOR_SM1_86-2]|nr:MAG: hypothetical protein A7315_12965 [Candidatus Altiarchaeales archaeon WOR_SM1_79]ODS38239.1 MAG: hypothetical protein A7316_01105 [Candidatus Altiarchaeales archaeon WOR_SM1_86-2]
MKTKSVSKDFILPRGILDRAEIEGDIDVIVKPHMVILKENLTKSTKGLVKPKIDISKLHEEYGNYLLKRGKGDL